MQQNTQVWNNLHSYYQNQDWIDKPNIFAEEVITYIPINAKILELGAGQGQDTRFFASKGFNIVSTDLTESALKINKEKLPPEIRDHVEIKQVDMTQKLPFADESFDVVYAHLSFHYFTLEVSIAVLLEISRILKKQGLLIMLNNSTTDPEYMTGPEIEKDYFFIEDKNKRFFSIESLSTLTKPYFEPILLDNLGETYKDSAKGIHNLIRYIGKKL